MAFKPVTQFAIIARFKLNARFFSIESADFKAVKEMKNGKNGIKIIAALAVFAFCVGTTVSAEAAYTATPVYQQQLQQRALNYPYYAGHPMYLNKSRTGWCTGSYTIHGASGSFILTAGHCGSPGTTVYGTNAPYAKISHRRDGYPLGDSALVSYYRGVTPYQIVVNPKNGSTTGNGKITGIMPNWEQTPGKLVGKMGVTTGWTEGTIVANTYWKGIPAKFVRYRSAPGDSGGPVWRNDGKGLRAVGMHVGKNYYAPTGEILAVYIPIEVLLGGWGAAMNTF